MIPVCSEDYFLAAQEKLSAMIEMAVYVMHKKGEEFINTFLSSPICHAFESGDPFILFGKSPNELLGILFNTAPPDSPHFYDASPEYWVGYVLAYVQYETDKPYKDLLEAFPYEDLLRAYFPYHEMDLTAILQVFREKLRDRYGLKAMRERLGISQAQLADLSGVPLRTIRSYEQGQNDIRKGTYETLRSLAATLRCEITDILPA